MNLKLFLKKFAAVGLAAFMLATFAACSAPAEEAPAPAEETPATEEAPAEDAAEEAPASDATIKFQQWWGAELPEGHLEGITADFEAATGVKVELVTAPWSDTRTAIVAGATNNTIADVVSVDGAWLSEFADMGILTDVAAAGVNTDLASDTWKVNGTQYVVPVLNFSYPMFVNMDILTEAGVEAVPQTWTELIDASAAITAAGHSAFALNLGTTNANGIQNVFGGTGWASGINLKDDAGAYTVAGSEGLKELAELFKTLYDAGSLYPGMSTLEESEMTSNFAAGNAAFTIASAATMSNFTDLNFVATTVPTKDDYTEAGGICYASWAVGITEASQYKAEAANFVNFLLGGADGTDGSASAGLAEAMTAFPNSTVATPDYSSAPQQFQDYYVEYQENYVINEYIGLPEASSVMTSMTNDLVLYLEGDLDVDTMLTNWQGYLDGATA